MTRVNEGALLDRARAGDNAAFDELVAPYRGELHAHCYRMLGSVHDADDALQDALLGAWRGLSGFEGRSTLRSWLYRIATHASMRVGRGRPVRVVSLEDRPPTVDPQRLGDPILDPVWLEPYPESLLNDAGPLDPSAAYDGRESAELAFIAALQHLPATQRAVLILREVLAFSAAEVAEQLDTSVAAVNSSLQRARARLARSGPSQQAVVRQVGEPRVGMLLDALLLAWQRADVPAILELLTEDVRFSMPPLPAWFDGRAAVGRFLTERMFAAPWRLRPMYASGQPAFACYQGTSDGSAYVLGGITVVDLRGDRIAALTSFLAPIVDARFGLPAGV